MLSILLTQSRVHTVWVIPMRSLARENVYSQPVTGCKCGVRARIYLASYKPNTVGEICAVRCWSYFVTFL